MDEHKVEEELVAPAPAYPLPPVRLLYIERHGYQHYKATIDKHAEVRWEGINDVLQEGRRLWALPLAKMELLRQTLEKYDFLHLDRPKDTPFPCYSLDPSSGTFTLTVIFMDGTRKTIVHDLDRQDMPRKLHQLERRLETILGTRKWAGPPMIIE
jgi:hypothetical protein